MQVPLLSRKKDNLNTTQDQHTPVHKINPRNTINAKSERKAQ